MANLANHPWFAKLKPSKLVLTINNLLADLLIHQTFFCQMLKKSQFTELFCYMVLKILICIITLGFYRSNELQFSLATILVLQTIWVRHQISELFKYFKFCKIVATFITSAVYTYGNDEGNGIWLLWAPGVVLHPI